MTIYELRIDGKLHYVRSTDKRLRVAMLKYIKEELARGRKLSQITYTWVPIRPTATI